MSSFTLRLACGLFTLCLLTIRLSANDDAGWSPGMKHPSARNVVAGSSENDWVPAPGYRWSSRNGGLSVRWSPRAKHPDHPHVIAGLIEGRWVPEPGYVWKDRSRLEVVADPDYLKFDSIGSSNPANSSGSPYSTPSSYKEPNWGWMFRAREIREEINRPYLPR